jgi:hypothetical protein
MKRERGKELQMMLDGIIPMSVFYRATSDTFDEKNGQHFDKFVKSGEINRLTFYIKNSLQNFTLFYTVYTLPGEEWRADLYKSLKIIGKNKWNEKLQKIEELLFNFNS